ncbi:unnamed protein product, partial [Medioppia subpectinata]
WVCIQIRVYYRIDDTISTCVVQHLYSHLRHHSSPPIPNTGFQLNWRNCGPNYRIGIKSSGFDVNISRQSSGCVETKTFLQCHAICAQTYISANSGRYPNPGIPWKPSYYSV